MAQILVQTNDGRHLLLDERDVNAMQLTGEQSGMQLLERLAWVIDDADARLARAKRKVRELMAPRVAPLGRRLQH